MPRVLSEYCTWTTGSAQAKGLRAHALSSQHCLLMWFSLTLRRGMLATSRVQGPQNPECRHNQCNSTITGLPVPKDKDKLSKNPSPCMPVGRPSPSLGLSRTKLQLSQHFPDGGEGSDDTEQPTQPSPLSSLLQMHLSSPHTLSSSLLKHEKS